MRGNRKDSEVGGLQDFEVTREELIELAQYLQAIGLVLQNAKVKK